MYEKILNNKTHNKLIINFWYWYFHKYEGYIPFKTLEKHEVENIFQIYLSRKKLKNNFSIST